MSLVEIEEAFAGEWVLVDEPQMDETLQLVKGKVLHHSKDRDEVYRKAVALRPKRSAILYTGRMPKETAIVL